MVTRFEEEAPVTTVRQVLPAHLGYGMIASVVALVRLRAKCKCLSAHDVTPYAARISSRGGDAPMRHRLRGQVLWGEILRPGATSGGKFRVQIGEPCEGDVVAVSVPVGGDRAGA